ncbi:iron ABC transporter substrate-binding protein [Microbacterium sp. Gd 4-13]|uniref:ABC transporter substrate-binding protein n=1 Tax=Microbacterium sp. Gd 4-13 TaxID=2173179 RepID=UPI000D56CE44|nr:iron-siderophore ABC transporter substrate-binding protein [Microbacterium sp. Gd 4-13]PVW03525.1 iron ABC transporter substrate-binding protein [Microbacterium sp. Gd 4-13]
MSSRLHRRWVALAATTASAALLLAGCSASAPSMEAANADTATTRQVQHARGTTEVPVEPQRVVTLEPLELDTAAAVGVVPVGAAVASNVVGVPAYLGLDAVEAVGSVPEPDLQAIAALKPDLILGTEARHSALYEQLSSIAPTVFIATQADPWRDNAALIGEALGREDETAALLEKVDARCGELADTYGIDGQTVQLVRPRDETTLSLYGPVSFAGSLLECVGFTIPAQDWADGLQADISPENILSAQADRVLVTTADTSDDSTIPAAIVQNADAFPSVRLVDTSYWVSGVGPLGAQKVLDDIEQFLEERS